jgi:LPPG:FO 2-phospho-L-lactate transferase
VAGGLLDGWLVDEADAATAVPLGVRMRSRPLLMTDLDAAAEIAGSALDLALEIGTRGT